LIRFVEETGSTNADIIAALRSSCPPQEGDWLVALRQTAGKGRQGREWFDGSGNFMGSTVVALKEGDPLPATLAFVAALAVEQALAAYVGQKADLSLKWPNDVLLNRGKISGILMELLERTVVVGIGVNLARAPTIEGRSTAALQDVADPPTPEGFAEGLAQEMERRIALWRSEGIAAVLRAFLDRSLHEVGSSITVHDIDGTRISGTFAGLEEMDGALRLRLADGSERVIRAGDVE